MKQDLLWRKSRWLFTIILFIFQSCSYAQNSDPTVCITRTGAKYHVCTCRYLRQGSFEITLAEATKRGYTACSVCKPQQLEDEEENADNVETAGSSGSNSTPVKTAPRTSGGNERTTTSRQCSGITKSGQRCKRMTTAANGRCYQH